MNDMSKKYHQLAPDLTICRIVNGMWQVAGGHGYIDHENIGRSLRRMSVSSLDLLQFHWWDYNNPYYMDALKYLSDIRDGVIKHIGLTNFDTERMQIMIDSDLQILSNQVQYSIIDRRPEVKMIPFCLEHNISLLAYGSICGGLISERYLGRVEPASADLNTL